MKFSSSVLAIAAAFAVAGAAGTALAADKGGGMMMMAPMHQTTIQLKALNGSGESGTAVLKDTAAHGVSVAIKVTGAPTGVPQPAHIHKGTCAKLDPKPEFPLSNVVNGMSNTVVPNTSVAKLMATPNAINIHKSAKELKTYVACGDIAKAHGAM
jgi:hypothetical protein